MRGTAAVAVRLQATARAYHADFALHISKFTGSRSCSNASPQKSQVLVSDPEGRSLQHADWMGPDRIRGLVEDREQPLSCIRNRSDDLVAQQLVLQSACKH